MKSKIASPVRLLGSGHDYQKKIIKRMSKKFIIFLLFMPQLFYGQWVPQVSGTTENLNDVFAVTENLVFAVGDNGTILKTTDGGVNWVQKISGTTQNLTRIQFANQDVGYAIGFNGILLKTTDGGQNWLIINTNILTNLHGLSVLDSNTIIISTTNGIIKKTIDSGSTFTQMNSPETGIISNMKFFGLLLGYVQSDNKLFKTNNGGSTWLQVNDSIDSFYFVNENLGFVTKSIEATLIKTIDGGINFSNIGMSNIFGKDLFTFNGDLVWDIGNNPALCSCDLFCINKKEVVGFSVLQDARLCQDVFFGGDRFNSIFFQSETIGYIVGLSGVIHKNNSGINVSLSNKIFDFNKKIVIAPNPATDQINISFNEKQNENFELEIVDNLGKKIFSTIYQPIDNIKIGIKSFSKGIYFINFSNSKGKQTQKFIIN